MHRPDFSIGLILVPIFFISITLGAAFSQDGPDESQALNQLVLNVYVDDGGKSLINGYVENPGSLAFLNSSEYTYEDESRQLYAITDSLTSKSGDSWNMSFKSKGRYDEYRVMFYLPVNAKLRGINCSSGLDYLVNASNKSVTAEVQGHDITNPAVNIDYILLHAEVS